MEKQAAPWLRTDSLQSRNPYDMCYDLIDPSNPGRGPAASTFGKTFGVNPADALNNPSGTNTNTIDGLTIVAPSHPQAPYIINTMPSQTITSFNSQIQPLDLPPLVQVVPWVGNFKMKAAPCLQRTPAGVNLAELLSKTFDSVLTAAVNSSGDKNEWGAFMVRLADNSVGWTPLFTANNPNNLIGAQPMFPSGSQKIVTFAHTHPRTSGTDQRFLGQADIDMMEKLINEGKADPDMIAVVANRESNDDNAYWHYYLYDRDHWYSNTPGCLLEVDWS